MNRFPSLYHGIFFAYAMVAEIKNTGGPGLHAAAGRAWFGDSLPVLWWDQPAVAADDPAPFRTLVDHAARQLHALREIWTDLKSGRLPVRLMAVLSQGNEIMPEDHNMAVSTTTLGNMLLLSIRRVSPLNKLTQHEFALARLFGQGKSHYVLDVGINLNNNGRVASMAETVAPCMFGAV